MACSACTTGRLCLPIYCNCYIHSTFTYYIALLSSFVLIRPRIPDLSHFPEIQWFTENSQIPSTYSKVCISVTNTYVHILFSKISSENIWPWKQLTHRELIQGLLWRKITIMLNVWLMSFGQNVEYQNLCWMPNIFYCCHFKLALSFTIWGTFKLL